MTLTANVGGQNPYQISTLSWNGVSIGQGQTIAVKDEKFLFFEAAAAFPQGQGAIWTSYRIVDESDGSVVSSGVLGSGQHDTGWIQGRTGWSMAEVNDLIIKYGAGMAEKLCHTFFRCARRRTFLTGASPESTR